MVDSEAKLSRDKPGEGGRKQMKGLVHLAKELEWGPGGNVKPKEDWKHQKGPGLEF